MTVRLILVFYLTVLMNLSIQSQGFGFGFKTGLNLSSISGTDLDGEENTNLTSFHIGVVASYKVTSNLGIRAELLYNQKGNKLKYNGSSYLKIPLEGGRNINLMGNVSTLVNITNEYISIPILVYYKFKKIEFSAGVGVGVLVGSAGVGDFRLTDATGTNSEGANISLDSYLFTVNANYLKDSPGEIDFSKFDLIALTSFPEKVPIELLAYSSYLNGETEKKFNNIDLFLLGGISYYINKGLYLGVRVNYSLNDNTNDIGDLSLDQISQNGTLVFNEEKNKFISFEFSIGFNF